MAGPDVDVVITEIGGTVGDIESLPFLEAARQVRHDVGRDNVLLPARLAGALHRALGRAEDQADPALGRRAALHRPAAGRDRVPLRPADPGVDEAQDLADVRRRRRGRGQRQRRAVDLRHPQGAALRGARRLRRTPAQPAVPRRRLDRVGRAAAPACTTRTRTSRSRWSASTSTCPTPTSRSRRRCAPAASPTRPRSTCVWVPSDECQTREGAARHLADVDAVCVPGGFGIRGIEGKVGALEYARTHGIPTLGLCLGLQCMVIEFARHVAGIEEADSTEFHPGCAEPVIATMAEQEQFVEGAGDLGGTMRLGLYPAELKDGLGGARRPTARPRSRSGTGTATRSTTPTATGSRRPGWCSPGTSPGQQPGRVRRAAARRAPLLRLDPGAPRAAVAADPAAPAVRGAGRGRDRPAARAAASRSTRPALRRRADEPTRPGRGRPERRLSRRRVRACADRPSLAGARRRADLAGRAPFSVRRDVDLRAGPRPRSGSAGWWSSTPAPWWSWRVDDDERVLVLRQYRHPAAQRFVELPAGPARRTRGRTRWRRRSGSSARRALLLAERVDATCSRRTPRRGCRSERIAYYLARGPDRGAGPGRLRACPRGGGHDARWVPVDDLLDGGAGGPARRRPDGQAVLAYALFRR